MTGSVDIAVHNAGNENVDSSNVAVNFSVFQYADRGARVFAADYIKPNMPVNVNATGKAQKVSINMS
jgi:ABC-type sulfate transport system substrate-binding protein